MGERCLLVNFVYPAVLCGCVLFYPCSQDKIIHFPMGFSGVLIAVISEHFPNSNLIPSFREGRQQPCSAWIEENFLIEFDFYFL